MQMMNNKAIRIGDILQEFGYVTKEDIDRAFEYKNEHKEARLGDALIALNCITEGQMLEALGRRLDYKVINVSDISVDIDALELVPKNLAEKYNILAYSITDNMLNILLNDPLDFYGIEDIRQVAGMDVIIGLCEKNSLQNAITFYYSEVSARLAAKKAAASSVHETEAVEINIDDTDDDTPIINLFNSIVLRAYNANASDIHIEPFEFQTNIRMRLDGVICDFMTLQKNIHNSLVARIKILGDLDIAERRVPQDGHFRITIEDVNINFRVSVIPTVFGEKVVLRLLTSAAAIDNKGTFGMTEKNYNISKKLLQSPNGIVYLTGPTGSGKSTTLYMMLEELSKKNVNISTIEDPVEKNVPKLNQMQVNNVAGLTFEVGLRALLRQDPDIIMLGETRDAETASISVRAAITGHLVLSTLHTNDSASSIVRLIDMGIEPYLLSSSLVGIVAQRLVRKVCPFCSETAPVTEEEDAILEHKIPMVTHVKGCRHCNNTGYKGRIAIHEILSIDKRVREMIVNKDSPEKIKEYAIREQGMQTLKTSALQLVEEGITTVEELLRVSYYE